MIDIDKFRHAFNQRTRKIQRMSINELNSYALSNEFLLRDHDSKYEKLLENGKMWDLKQAIHLLVKEDPDDHQWAPKSGFGISNDYLTMKRAMDEDHKMGKLSLTAHTNLNGESTFIAENFIFIRWAKNRGFKIPVIFEEYLVTHDANVMPPNDACSDATINETTYPTQQLLSRPAIILNYCGGNKNLNEKKWQRIFANEKKNRLFEAKVKNTEKNNSRYYKNLVESWLMENAYLTVLQISKMTLAQTAPPTTLSPWKLGDITTPLK